MASGFYEIEGGTQPALPAAGFGRIWYDTVAQRWKVLLSDGSNTTIETLNITGQTLLADLALNDEYLIYDVSAAAFRKVRAQDSTPLAIENRFITYDEDEFAGTSSAGKLNWTATAAGTAASAQTGTYGVNGTERAFGVLQLDTGSTATGRVALNRLAAQVQLGYATVQQDWRLALEALSTGTERFLVTFGFISNTGAGTTLPDDHTHGVFFRYRDDLNGGQWQCVCRQANIQTVVDTTVAANTQYNRFRIVINEAGTEALFYIGGNLVGTITTNIPTTGGNLVTIGCKIEKTIGTTQRNLSIDYFTQRIIWPSGR
jgi:hypothetical protein